MYTFIFFQLNVLQNQAEELLKMLMKTVKNQRETIKILLLKHTNFRQRRAKCQIIIQIIDFGVYKKLDVLQQVKQKTLPEGDSLELTQFHTF